MTVYNFNDIKKPLFWFLAVLDFSLDTYQSYLSDLYKAVTH